MLFVLSMILAGTAWGEASFSKEQIIKMGHVVLSAQENREYKEIFWNAQPDFDDKTATWRFTGGFPVTPGGAAYVFEFRDADGFYRLGWVTGQKSSQGFDRYRIQSSTRSELTELMKTFRKK